jgi:hypothetical protein
MSELDTGNIVETCFVDAPWGSQSWGVEASSFLDTNNNQLDAARFRAYGNRAYLYGRETAGSWGFARFVQGDIWGGSNCDQPIRWHVPEPLPVADRQLYIDMRALRDITELSEDGWIMFAINVWLHSDYLPDTGGVREDNKPLVIDLALYQDCNFEGCSLNNFESESAFHYQVLLDRQAPAYEWQEWEIDLTRVIEDAVAYEWPGENPPSWDVDSLKLYQLDVLVELRNAEGALTVDRLALRWQDK